MTTRYRIFLVVAPGLEETAGAELHHATGAAPRVRAGGVECTGDLATLHACVTELRIPDGVRVRIGHFPAHNFDELAAGLERVPWHAYLPRAEAEVRVSCHKSALYHSDAVAERALDVLARTVRDSGDEPLGVPRVYLRIERDHCTVSVDATGEQPHIRGWPRDVAPAGLRDTLAAGALAAAGLIRGGLRELDPSPSVLWDPFCGAGTFGLEWVSARLGLPALGPRTFALEWWPSLRGRLPDREPPAGRAADAVRPSFIGTDSDPKVIASARANADARGLAEHTSFFVGDVRTAAEHAPSGVAVIANLPYGKRTVEARAAIAAFGEVIRARPDLQPVFALDGTGKLDAITGLEWKKVVRFQNRGLTVTLQRLAERDA